MSAAHDLLNSAAPLVSLAAVVLLASRQRVVRVFLSRQAVAPPAAIPFDPSSALRRLWLRKFLRAGVLKRTGGRYWLDEPAWQQYRENRRRRALAIAAIALVVAAAIVLMNFRND